MFLATYILCVKWGEKQIQYCTEALQRKTILHRGFTESIKRKHTEDNKAYRKHRHSEGDGYSLKRGK